MTSKYRSLAILAVMGALASGHVHAQGAPAYGEVLPKAGDAIKGHATSGNWNIFVNSTRNNCFAERRSDTSIMQIGVTKSPVLGYIGIFTQAPTDMKSGKIDDITLEMDGRRFMGQVTEVAGNVAGGLSGGYVVSQDAGFIGEVAGARTMVATVHGREPVTIDLKGTSRAIDAVQACNQAHNS